MIGYSDLNNSIEINEDSMHRGQSDDPIDRATRHLKNIYHENNRLQQQIYQLQNNPKSFINPIRNQMLLKIQQLQNQNVKLKKMVDKSKLPAYTQFKRKSIALNDNGFNVNNKNNNLNGNNVNSRRDSMRNSLNQSLRNSINLRSVLSQINSQNFDKNESASTCFNEEQKYSQLINPILKLQKPSQNQEQQRERLTQQIYNLIAKTEIFQEALEEMAEKDDKQLEKIRKMKENQQSTVSKIQEYKNKLLRLLNKLKSREVQMDEMVKMYKQLHEQTLKKLQQSAQALRLMQEKKIDLNIEEKYAEVIQLEEKLQIINSEIEQMNQEKWLAKMLKQLSIVCNRLGVSVPKCESDRQKIDELCETLIQAHLMTRNDVHERLAMLKEYHEEEKQNNQRLIQALKTQEQVLGKKLTMIQMQKENCGKK